jgi:hypothetical protein
MISSLELFRIDLNDFLKVFLVCKVLRTGYVKCFCIGRMAFNGSIIRKRQVDEFQTVNEIESTN